MGRRSWITVLAAILWLGWSVSSAGERLLVYAVNYPLQYFAQRIAGDHADGPTAAATFQRRPVANSST